ncbi:MAG: hypothetical protein M3Q31_05530 [Actinomycetota bacterium]|nr:hypothetical protein [Actinomycetota bacterium]
MTPNTKTIAERVQALKLKSDAEDERDRMISLGADQDSSDLHARALLALAERGIADPSPEEYVQAVDLEQRADEPETPANPRPDYDALHSAATELLKSRGKFNPTYYEYSDALAEVNR